MYLYAQCSILYILYTYHYCIYMCFYTWVVTLKGNATYLKKKIYYG